MRNNEREFWKFTIKTIRKMKRKVEAAGGYIPRRELMRDPEIGPAIQKIIDWKRGTK